MKSLIKQNSLSHTLTLKFASVCLLGALLPVLATAQITVRIIDRLGQNQTSERVQVTIGGVTKSFDIDHDSPVAVADFVLPEAGSHPCRITGTAEFDGMGTPFRFRNSGTIELQGGEVLELQGSFTQSGPQIGFARVGSLPTAPSQNRYSPPRTPSYPAASTGNDGLDRFLAECDTAIAESEQMRAEYMQNLNRELASKGLRTMNDDSIHNLEARLNNSLELIDRAGRGDRDAARMLEDEDRAMAGERARMQAEIARTEAQIEARRTQNFIDESKAFVHSGKMERECVRAAESSKSLDIFYDNAKEAARHRAEARQHWDEMLRNSTK